eukprot:TRINITY_DN31471_c0_g1_i2.p1 TRINITY_DN31471_c0_g1~~TRINITY_DN31471_c0_g1_i2.p1  ORF type:complete len:321 (-),score=47.51 TRINITY_DN31471_c0_g1_i2:40-1002(-)
MGGNRGDGQATGGHSKQNDIVWKPSKGGGKNKGVESSDAWDSWTGKGASWSHGRSGGSSYSYDDWDGYKTGGADGGWQESWHDSTRQRPLASLFRFAHRVLQRHAPEERVYDMRHQLSVGDHVIVRRMWECSDQHGIVCSMPGYGDRGESPWVIHWDGEQLQNSPLSKLSKGGEVFRMAYPHWVCQCLEPASSTSKPQILEERWVEPASTEVVLRFASGAQRSASWMPSWSAASADLEFCLCAKTGGGSSGSGMPSWEIHSRNALSWSKASDGMPGLLPGSPLGCSLRGQLRPSELLSGSDRAAIVGRLWHPTTEARKYR